MVTRKAPDQKEPTLCPDRTIRALQEQLDSLQKLRNRNYQEADLEETEWEHLTRGILEAGFGDSSSSLSKFHMARNAGHLSLRGVSPQQSQTNFNARINQQEALLRGLIKTLQLQLPEENIKAIYESGDEYAFYRDLSALVAAVTQDILIVDAYLDEQLFNLYVSKVSAGVNVRILSNKIGANVVTVAKMYASSTPLEMRSSANVHDRAIFLDQRGWVIGQSIKDAARKKPTYLIELNEPLLTASRDVHNQIWKAATVVI